MYYTYVLKSKKNNKYYVGYTSDLSERIKVHNSNSVKATKKLGPWELFYSEIYPNEQTAMKREKQIKSWKSRNAIERLKFK